MGVVRCTHAPHHTALSAPGRSPSRSSRWSCHAGWHAGRRRAGCGGYRRRRPGRRQGDPRIGGHRPDRGGQPHRARRRPAPPPTRRAPAPTARPRIPAAPAAPPLPPLPPPPRRSRRRARPRSCPEGRRRERRHHHAGRLGTDVVLMRDRTRPSWSGGRDGPCATSSWPSTARAAASGPTPSSSNCTGPRRPRQGERAAVRSAHRRLEVARRTDGAVDPTVGNALEALGYDRDFAELDGRSARDIGHVLAEPMAAPGWWRVELDPARRTVRVPPGTHRPRRLGQGARRRPRRTSYRRGDRCRRAREHRWRRRGRRGPRPSGGWAVGIAETPRRSPGTVHQVVTINSGGLATSSTSVRTWSAGRRPAAPHRRPHHRRKRRAVLDARVRLGGVVCRRQRGQHGSDRLGPARRGQAGDAPANRRAWCATTASSPPSTAGRADRAGGRP